MVRAQDGQRLSATGACISDFVFPGEGTWLVRLTIRDTNTGGVARSLSTVEITGATPPSSTVLQGLSVNVTAQILE